MFTHRHATPHTCRYGGVGVLLNTSPLQDAMVEHGVERANEREGYRGERHGAPGEVSERFLFSASVRAAQ
jgi:hypothetical protein